MGEVTAPNDHSEGNGSVKEHPLVRKSRRLFRKTKVDFRGLLRQEDDQGLPINVGEGNLERAFRDMDIHLKAWEAEGFKPSLAEEGEYRIRLQIDGEELGVQMREITYCIKHKLTRAEKKLKEENRYLFSVPEWDYRATGKLQLQIEPVPNIRCKWSDCMGHKLEDCVDKFVEGLRKVVERKWDWRVERERWKRKWEAESMRRRVAQKRHEQIESEIELWRRYRVIEDYLDAARDHYLRENGSVEPGSPFEEWFHWAKEYASEFNPLPPGRQFELYSEDEPEMVTIGREEYKELFRLTRNQKGGHD